MVSRLVSDIIRKYLSRIGFSCVKSMRLSAVSVCIYASVLANLALRPIYAIAA